jgi:hypothetical protein
VVQAFQAGCSKRVGTDRLAQQFRRQQTRRDPALLGELLQGKLLINSLQVDTPDGRGSTLGTFGIKIHNAIPEALTQWQFWVRCVLKMVTETCTRNGFSQQDGRLHERCGHTRSQDVSYGTSTNSERVNKQKKIWIQDYPCQKLLSRI